MLEDLKAIQSRDVDGFRHYSLAPGRTLRYVRRSEVTDEPVIVTARRPVRYDSAIEYLRQTMPQVSEFEAMLRRGC